MPVILRPITEAECEQVRIWRNAPDVFPILRTGYKTKADQAAFYRDVVCNPASPHRYYALESDRAFIGIGGLTYLDMGLGEAEISLVLGPAFRGRGLGSAAVEALLDEGRRLGLLSVIGECYSTGNVSFWTKQIARRPAWLHWRWVL